ncbi:MAG: hypothetical protein C4541_05550 [Candidatus Auribacter fodinae]|uniref:Uncharacterized protein n=1 Tax=Candidatus Auribacter fodinae TaxID=2093366 RepID=A0A3A4RDP5_9BACT|nr:MAG: hypothetical protein C4541_05550 [Candidatus Auribacter fodinae]
MSNISSINGYNASNNQHVLNEKERTTLARQNTNQEKIVKDVVDEQLKNSIKKLNLQASSQDIVSAEEASDILSLLIQDIGDNSNAANYHSKMEPTRVNALINQ